MKWWFYRIFGPVIWQLKKLFNTSKFWPYGQECPRCSFYGFDWGEPPWFEFEDGGVCGSPDMPTTHWFRGTQQCPRCRWKWSYADSD